VRVALLAVALLLAGCPRPPPLDFGAHGRLTDPAVALEALRARREKARSVNGEARTLVETPDGSGRLTQFVVAERPNRFRIESLSFFGSPLAVMASDGQTFRLHDLENGQFFEQPADAASLARLVPLRIPVAELVDLLVGTPPLLEGEVRRFELVPEWRAYQLWLGRGEEIQELGLDPATLRPLWVAFRDRPMLSPYRADFEQYEGDEDRPRVVKLRSPDGKTRVELNWRERELDEPVDERVFVLQR
jgi:hypothetical protein